MPFLHWDIETRSAANLTALGARNYAADPSTVALCIAYAVDHAEPAIWTPGMPVPQPFIEAAANTDWCVIAHNHSFELEIEARILVPRYGWPAIPLERRRCSMALARANGLPGSLEDAAILLGLVNQKDQAGHALMLEMCDASKPLDLSKLDRLCAYCMQDVRVERELSERLPPLPPGEENIWQLDQTINARGFAIDLTLAHAARKVAEEEKQDINARITTLTNGEITTAHQNQRILKYVRERGHTAKSLGKRSVAQILAHNPDDETRQILELRRAGGRTSVTKFHAAITLADADSRVRDTFRYYGSHTGRWAGRSFQPQNLPKVTLTDIDTATDAVQSGDHARVRSLNGGDTLSIISNVVRNVIIAPPGHVLIGADFSAIESRVLAWLAGEQWKLNNYREFDCTNDPRLEPYCATATRMLHREVTPSDEAGRQHGKVADLALGFGGSVMAWRKFMPADPRNDEQITRETVKPWRAAHPAVRKFWYGIERLFKTCTHSGKPATYGRIAAEMHDGALRLTLPSNRCLVYRDAHLGPGKFEGSVDLHFHNGYQLDQAWRGTIVENIVQGVARDLLADAMMRLETAGFPVVLHCHDEVVCEIPEAKADEAPFLELMITLPDWAADLPIAAKPWTGSRYGKSKASAAPEETSDDEADADEDIEAQLITQDDLDEINTGLRREGIAPIDVDAGAAGDATLPWSTPILIEVPPGSAEFEAILASLSEEDRATVRPEEAPRGNGHDHDRYHAENGAHDNEQDQDAEPDKKWSNYGSGEKDTGKSYGPVRTALHARGYRVARTFTYALPSGAELFYEDRYELGPQIKPTKERPHKTSRFWHRVNGEDRSDTGPRRIVYNWPAIMAAGPGAIVCITEGANKSAALAEKALLATAAPYHQWGPECVSALAGYHLIYLADHNPDGGNDPGPKYAADAQKKLAPVAASFRIVPALHLWKHLPAGARAIRQGDDVKDWLKLGGDPAKLIEICQEILAKLSLPFIDMSRWDDEEPPRREWAVDNRVPLYQTALFSGEGATGKSTLLLQECFAHALMREWLGVVPKPGPALFIDAEDDKKEVHRRARDVVTHYGASFEEAIRGGLHLMSFAGEDAVLATVSRSGKIEPTPLYGQLLEAAGDIKPVMIGIASSANVFAGNENDRAQVQQFVGLLTRMAIFAGGAVQLISHPSLTGINSDSGISGTTQWHNAVRARCYLKSIKPEAGEQPDTDLREIVFKKNQYGPISESIALRYQGGLFLPVEGMSLDQAAQAAVAQDVFLTLLKRFNAQNRDVSSRPSVSYAPALFAREMEAKAAMLTGKHMEAAMRQLFKDNRIWNEPCGKPSRPRFRLAVK